MSEQVVAPDEYLERPEAFNPLAGHPDPEGLYQRSLFEGTSLAGREKPFNWELDAIMSEGALHRYRAQVEIEALINLAEHGPLPKDTLGITDEEKAILRTLYEPSVFDAFAVQRKDHIDHAGKGPLEHDVKAVEHYTGELLEAHGLGRLREWVHFGMTSEDANNLAFNYMLRDATNQVLIPAVGRVADRLAYMAATYGETPVSGKTHAQKASPTTVGKQFGYLLSGITQTLEQLDGMRLSGKFSGAVGNHNPMSEIFPNFDYDAYARDFVESQGFTYSAVENQRNNHLAVAQLLGTVNMLSVVGKNASDNIWLMINDGNLVQEQRGKEAGSSTMAHKINPWRLEGSEGYFEQAIALGSRAPEGLAASRHERDLSDHPWQRAYGEIFGKVVASYNYLSMQMDSLAVNEEKVGEDLDSAWEVLSELVQTAGRVAGVPSAYDKVKDLTQGKAMTAELMQGVITQVLPEGELRDRVARVTPDTYVGIAPQLARRAVAGWHAANVILRRGVLDESTSIDAVLFDFDGTLHFGDKNELHARLAHIAEQLGSGFTLEEIQDFGNRSDYKEMRSLMVVEHNRRHLSNQITEEGFEYENRLVSSPTYGMFDEHFYTADGAQIAIDAMRHADKKTGLVTTRGANSLPRLLKLHGLDGSFDAVVDRTGAARKKPHPQPIVLALQQLGITDPSRALYVGDKQIDDVGAGRALGMKTALISQDPYDPYGPIPTYRWSDLGELVRRYGR